MENASRYNAPTPSGAWDTSRLKAGHEVWRLTPTEQDRARLWSAAGRPGREPDPVWEALRSRIRTGLDAFGFALVRQLFPAGPVADVHQEADVTERVSRLVRDFGEIVPQNGAGDVTQVLRRREGDPDEIAFHCDTCDLLVLLCLRPAARGGATRVAGAPYIHDVLAAERPDVLELLGQKWYFDRAAARAANSSTPRSSPSDRTPPSPATTSPERYGPPPDATGGPRSTPHAPRPWTSWTRFSTARRPPTRSP